ALKCGRTSAHATVVSRKKDSMNSCGVVMWPDDQLTDGGRHWRWKPHAAPPAHHSVERPVRPALTVVQAYSQRRTFFRYRSYSSPNTSLSLDSSTGITIQFT